jgi:hypothetical protein
MPTAAALDRGPAARAIERERHCQDHPARRASATQMPRDSRPAAIAGLEPVHTTLTLRPPPRLASPVDQDWDAKSNPRFVIASMA